MFKEVIISIIIVLCIIVLDIITQNYTKETVIKTSEMLSKLKYDINNNEENIFDEIEKIYAKWEERHGKLAYFIEHDELEKVETNLTNIRSFIEENDLIMAINGVDETKFILEHIKEKNALELENIF